MTIIGDVGDLQLSGGGMLPGAKLAYITYGRLAPDGRNAILLTHGYTSSHMFAHGGGGSSEGSWASLVGPGRPIDTDRYFVVSSNMLGSSYGSTAPRSINPATDRPYGPDFPAISVTDIVTAQRRLLDRLGVKQLAAVVGPSYGGYQAFAWGIEFPEFMRGLVPVVTGLKRPARMDIDKLQARLATHPNWNGGHYYNGGITEIMATIREETIRGYGIEEELRDRFPNQAARDAEIRRVAMAWAREFDGHSLLVLGRAAMAFDASSRVDRIKAPVLYVLSRTDAIFPPSLAPETMAALKRIGVRAWYFEIDSVHGHLASGTDAAKWAPELRAFLDGLPA